MPEREEVLRSGDHVLLIIGLDNCKIPKYAVVYQAAHRMWLHESYLRLPLTRNGGIPARGRGVAMLEPLPVHALAGAARRFCQKD
jgi:hypothetical protein